MVDEGDSVVDEQGQSRRQTDEESHRERVSELFIGFVDGELEPLATAMQPDVQTDLSALLNPEAEEPLIADPISALQRLRNALIAQSAEPVSVAVHSVDPETPEWDGKGYCGTESDSSRFEATIECKWGTHHVGIGMRNDEVVELAFLDGYSPPSTVDTDAFTETELQFENDGLEFGGTLTLPAEDDPTACVVLVHGAGETDRNYEIGAQQFLKDIAWGLADRGIASYRYDKRSYFADIDQSEIRLDWPVVGDALAATRAVTEHPDVDEDILFLAGHSRGGMFAPRIAEHYENYRGVLILEGYAQSFPGYIAELSEEQRSKKWVTERERAAIDKVISQARAFLDDDAETDTEQFMGRPIEYIEELSEYNKPETAASLDSPVFVLQGGADFPGFKRRSADLWRDALQQTESEVVYSEEYNHYLQRMHGPSVGVESGFFHDNVAADNIDEIADWISLVSS